MHAFMLDNTTAISVCTNGIPYNACMHVHMHTPCRVTSHTSCHTHRHTCHVTRAGMHARTHTHTHTYTHTHTHTYTHKHIHTHTKQSRLLLFYGHACQVKLYLRTTRVLQVSMGKSSMGGVWQEKEQCE